MDHGNTLQRRIQCSGYSSLLLASINLLAFLAISAQAAPAANAGPTSLIPTISLGPSASTSQANITSLLAHHLSHDCSLQAATNLNKRQSSGIIGSGICATSMSGFTCDPSHHEENRCAGDGDDYRYCICAGSASLPGLNPQGLWLNTAWGPGCYACYDKERGHVFDGTCNGDGDSSRGTGQDISEILATLTITVTEWIQSTISPNYPNGATPIPIPFPETTVTRIVTVTNVSSSGQKRVDSWKSSSWLLFGAVLAPVLQIAVRGLV